MQLNYNFSEEWLSVLDSAFMLFSTLGNLVTGPLVDRYPLNVVLFYSILSSCVLYLCTSVVGYFEITVTWIYLALIALQGIAQSPIYPGCVSLLGHSFPKQTIGRAMSLLSTSISFGNFLGAFITGIFMYYNLTWVFTMIVYTALEFFIGFFLYLQVSKNYKSSQSQADSKNERLLSPTQSTKTPIPLLQILKVPYFKSVILSKVCIKFSYYSLSMWMPLYLNTILQDSWWVGTISGSIEIGCIVGALVCGFISDLVNTRPAILQVYLIVSIPIILLIGFKALTTPWGLLLLFFFAGFCVGGCNLILITVVPIDLSQHPSVIQYEVIGSVTGILDASGSFGASIGIFFIGHLIQFSWLYVFLLITLSILSSLLVLTPYSLYELKLKKSISINS